MGNLTSILWKQIDPQVDLSSYNGQASYWAKSEVKNKYIFDGLQGMDTVTKYLSTPFAYQKLRMSTFNYYKETDSFRFMVKAENTHSQYQTDVIEIGINDPPKGKDVIITSNEKYNNYTMRTFFNISALGWYDTLEDTQQELSYKLYLETASSKRFLIFPSTYQHSTFINVLLPFTTDTYEHATLDLYIVAQDRYAAQTTRQFNIMVTNAYQEHQRAGVMRELMKVCANDSIREPYYQLIIANTLEVVLESSRILEGSRCLTDWQCFQGKCISGQCECVGSGSSESWCQISVEEEWMAKEMAKLTLEQVPSYFSQHRDDDDYLNTDLEYLVMLLRGFSKSFTTLDPYLLNQTLKYLNHTLSAHLEVVITYQKAFYDDFYETISRIYSYLNMFENQDGLFKLVRECEHLFTRGLILKLNKQSFYEYSYTTTYLSIRLYRVHSQELLNNTRNSLSQTTIFRLNEIATFLGQDLEIRAPPDFLKDVPQVNEVSDLRVRFVKYGYDPSGRDVVMESEVVEFELLDANAERIIPGNQGKGMVEVRIPYKEKKRMDPQLLRCMSRESDEEDYSKEGCGLQIYDQVNCINCTGPGQQNAWKMAVCYCDRLSRSYSLIFDEGEIVENNHPQSNQSQIGTNPKLGIYTDFYAMNFWRESFGFIVILGAVSLYIVGLFLSQVFDVQPQKRLTFALMRDFRSFDTYLFQGEDNGNNQTMQALAGDDSLKVDDPNQLTPQMFSHYNRERMPLSGLLVLEELYPELRFLDLTPEELAKIRKNGEEDEGDKVVEVEKKDNDGEKGDAKEEERYEGGAEEAIEEELKEEDPQSVERRPEEAKKNNSPTRQPRGGRQQTTQARKVKDRSQTFNLTNVKIPPNQAVQEQNIIQKLLKIENPPSHTLGKEEPQIITHQSIMDTNTKILDITDVTDTKLENRSNTIEVKMKKQKFVNPTRKKIFEADDDQVVVVEEVKETKKEEKPSKEEKPIDPLELERQKEERRKKRQEKMEAEVDRQDRSQESERFKLINLLKYGNPIANLLFVDSILFPRHARWTLLFINVMLIWFFCAVIYNNTKSPLDVPDFSKKASKLAAQELWISAFAPFGNILMMYLFAALFRISNQRIKYASDLASVKEMLNELKKEMFLRFLMAYFIAFAMFGAVSYYILQFTSSFGWKISWAWWFSGCGAAIMNFVVIDVIVSIGNWAIYRIYKPLGRVIEEIRSVKQAREEA